MIEFAAVIIGFTVFLLMGMSYIAKKELKKKRTVLEETVLKNQNAFGVSSQPMTNKQLAGGVNVIEFKGERPPQDEFWLEKLIAELSDKELLNSYNSAVKLKCDSIDYLYANELEYRGLEYDL